MAEQEPVRVASGSFRVDRARALEKLSAFQLQDPADAFLAFIRCAVASGASSVRIRADGAEIRFDGRPLSAAELEDPFAALFAEEGHDERGRQLAVGLLGALRLPTNGVSLAGGEKGRRRSLTLSSALEFEGADEPGQEVETVVGLRGLRWRSSALMQRLSGLACAVPVRVGDDEVPRLRGSELSGVHFEEDGGLFGFVSVPREPEAESRLRLYQLGVPVGETSHSLPKLQVEGYVNCDRFTLNASQSAVVHNEAFALAMGRVAGAAERLALQTAEALRSSLPVTARLVTDADLASQWRDELLGEGGRLLAAGRALAQPSRWLYFLFGGDRRRFEAAEARVRLDARRCRWLLAIVRLWHPAGGKDDLGHALWNAPTYLDTRGGTFSLTELSLLAGREGKIRVRNGLFRGSGPRSVWCSTREEVDTLRGAFPQEALAYV